MADIYNRCDICIPETAKCGRLKEGIVSLHNIHYRTTYIVFTPRFIAFFVFYFLAFTPHNYTQNFNDPDSLLVEVINYYEDPCVIGVHSSLIDSLYKFSDNAAIKSWLTGYENLRNRIESFRISFFDMITNDAAFILDHSRVLEGKEINFVNAAAIYLGTDKITNLSLSYLIVRTAVSGFYEYPVRFLNFDEEFKSELTGYGDDWYLSSKLKTLNGWEHQVE